MLLRSKLVKDDQAIKHTHVCELNFHCVTPSSESFNSKIFQATVVYISNTLKLIDILISKNQALQIIFLFQCVGRSKRPADLNLILQFSFYKNKQWQNTP